jgi:hypothetical protein
MPYRVIFLTGNYSHRMALMSADRHVLQIFHLSDLPFRRSHSDRVSVADIMARTVSTAHGVGNVDWKRVLFVTTVLLVCFLRNFSTIHQLQTLFSFNKLWRPKRVVFWLGAFWAEGICCHTLLHQQFLLKYYTALGEKRPKYIKLGKAAQSA